MLLLYWIECPSALNVSMGVIKCIIDGRQGWNNSLHFPDEKHTVQACTGNVKEAWREGGLCMWYSVCEDGYLQLPQGVVTLLLSCCLLGAERDQLVNTLCHRPETHRQPHRLFSSHMCPRHARTAWPHSHVLSAPLIQAWHPWPPHCDRLTQHTASDEIVLSLCSALLSTDRL